MRLIDKQLFDAVQRGEVHEAEEALNKNANPNASFYGMGTSLHQAMKINDYTKVERMVGLLLSWNASPNARDAMGDTPADLAERFNVQHVIPMLLEEKEERSHLRKLRKSQKRNKIKAEQEPGLEESEHSFADESNRVTVSLSR